MEVGMSISNQQHTEDRTYEHFAHHWGWIVKFVSLGKEGVLRQTVVDSLDLKPNQSVLDIGCGTGRTFPYIIQCIGAGGHLIGLDHSPAMLKEAQALVDRNGWNNVELVEGDAAQMSFGQVVDAATCVLAVANIPDYREAICRMVAAVRPGGKIVIADARIQKSGHRGISNWVAKLIARYLAADLSREPEKEFAQIVDDYSYREIARGFYFIASGKAPAKQTE
jgi:ubiquinone/menaquinone biosynthesis C-methylase UbiE